MNDLQIKEMIALKDKLERMKQDLKANEMSELMQQKCVLKAEIQDILNRVNEHKTPK